MKELFICDTPYQLLNVLNIVFHDYDIDTDEKCVTRDLYIINQFKSASNLKDRIAEKNIFSHVYLLKKDDTKFMKVGIKRHIRMSADFLGPRTFLSKRFKDYDMSQLSYEDYDVVYASGAFSTVAAILKINPRAKFILYDDGLGSYSGDFLIRSSGGKLNRAFCMLFHVGSYVCKPEKLLINNVSICHSTSVKKEDIYPLPSFDKSFVEFCNEIFDCVDVDNKKIVWLSQPMDCSVGAMETRDLVRDVLLNFKKDITVRMHPRDLDKEYYQAFNIDDGKDLWELSILNRNPEELILLGSYSSAQITPKILFDFEPTLVFLFLLNSQTSTEEKTTLMEKVKEIKSIYKYPDRVFVPNDRHELAGILKTMIIEKTSFETVRLR